MNFDWTDEDVKYREDIQEFLAEMLPRGWNGYDHTNIPEYERESKKFAAATAERGWLTQNWPKEYGGQEAPAWHAAILSEEFWPLGEPRGPQYMNVNWIGPAIMEFGTDEQKAYHLNRISKGDVCWCQGFSEPDAGSDLGSLRTAAVRDGDEYVVNGQKIWTSHTPLAEFMFLLVRTDPKEKRSKGISCLIVPMDTPGLEIKAVPGFVGETSFSNPVFTDMRIPVANRIGEENEGWTVVRYALAFERVGAAHHKSCERRLNQLAKRAHELNVMDDVLIRTKFAECWAATEAARLLFYRVVDLRTHGSGPTADSNISRVAGSAAQKLIMELSMMIYGEACLEAKSEGDARRTMASSVAAGTTEIQLDQIATRMLDLPRPAIK